jgi:hypothetical protein
MIPAPRTATCGKAEGASRLAVAVGYLEAAKREIGEHGYGDPLNVASGNAVLAGIAAGDAICCLRLGRMHRGTSHSGAAGLLSIDVPDGKALSQTLLRLLSVKDEAHYGVFMTSSRKANDAVKWADALCRRAQEELDR